jgi:hypothetical protein
LEKLKLTALNHFQISSSKHFNIAGKSGKYKSVLNGGMECRGMGI